MTVYVSTCLGFPVELFLPKNKQPETKLSPRDPIIFWEWYIMETKYYAEKVIGHPNHHLDYDWILCFFLGILHLCVLTAADRYRMQPTYQPCCRVVLRRFWTTAVMMIWFVGRPSRTLVTCYSSFRWTRSGKELKRTWQQHPSRKHPTRKSRVTYELVCVFTSEIRNLLFDLGRC